VTGVQTCALPIYKVTLIKAYAGLGEAYHKADQPKLATKNYLLSLSHAKTLKDGNAIIKASKELGELYAEEQDYGLSVQYYTYAIKEAKKLNNEVLEAEVIV